MRTILAIFKKDLKTNVLAPSSFFIFALFALLGGFFFFANLMDYESLSTAQTSNLPGFAEAVFSPLIVNAVLVLLFLIPVITMRSFVEERKSGALELLFTYPVSDFEIVAG